MAEKVSGNAFDIKITVRVLFERLTIAETGERTS